MSEDLKWACEYCTYENFLASKRCTLCRAVKPIHYISDVQNEEQDIYKMAPQKLSQPSPSGSSEKRQTSSSLRLSTSSSYDPTNKWACHICTYHNWPRSTKCTQCLTAKRNSLSHTSPSKVKKQSLSASISSDNTSGSSSPKSRPSNTLEAAEAINNDVNKTLSSVVGTKWMCRACTYYNWPIAGKCILCNTSRCRSSPDHQAGLPSCSSISSPSVEQSRKEKTSPSAYKLTCSSTDVPSQMYGGAAASVSAFGHEDKPSDRRLRQLHKQLNEQDWLWLNACIGVVEGDSTPITTYISSGGDAARQLTGEEVAILNRPSAFEVGYTLVHLAIRFKREDILACLLTVTDVASKATKRLPSHINPVLATEIKRNISSSLQQLKGGFPCYFLTECVTFALPTDIEDFPRLIQTQVFEELLDGDVQKELEEEFVTNWSLEITEQMGSRLYALWNRTAGDCLLDSILQATWSVFDIDNILRRALADSLNEGSVHFYPRWKEYETMQAQSMHFMLEENQWQHDWAVLLSVASQPGAALEQAHVFALAHILRRPIIVYGVKYVKSFRGETIGYARFQGVYLPLLWEQSFCWKTPIALGYTRGHFSALVPMETNTDELIGAGANINSDDEEQIFYLPLVDYEGKLLPVHFLTGLEVGREESLLRDWVDCCITKGGLLVAVQKLEKQPHSVKQMVEEWLDHYRQLSRLSKCHQQSLPSQTFSSDEDSEEE